MISRRNLKEAFLKNQIIIIGSSVSGMAISHSLTQQKINHIMIGPPPNDLPKLGESMNPEGSTELCNLFPDYKECFHDKPRTTIAVGNYQVECDFSGLRAQKTIDTFLNTLSPGIHIPKEMMHIDRLKFDKKLNLEVRKSPYLTTIDSKVVSLCHSNENITSIELENGEVLNPKYVFDCTNHARLIGRSLNIPVESLSQKQRVVFSHYHSDQENIPTMEWEGSTNLLRIEKEVDGIEGFAWCIPIGDYISVGITVNLTPENETFTKEEILSKVENAYATRGLNFIKKYPQKVDPVEVRGQYFKHSKAYGKNWVMVGGSYGQIWYMSGSGLGTALSCSAMASQLIQTPLKAGAAYQKYMDQFIHTHWPVDWFIQVNPNQTTLKDFKNNVMDWLMSNVTRLTIYPVIRMKAFNNFLGIVSHKILQANLVPKSFFSLEKYCRTNMLSSRSLMWDASRPSDFLLKRSTIIELTETISDKRPISYANAILHPRIKLWMDDIPFMGRFFWKIWVLYLREHSFYKDLSLVLESTKLHQNILYMRAGWYGRKNPNDSIERIQDVYGQMEVKNGKIIKIKTHKSNYLKLLGQEWNSTWFFLWKLFPISLWALVNFKKVLQKHEINPGTLQGIQLSNSENS